MVISFVQKINKMAMESYEQNVEGESKVNEKMVNKVISLLMLTEVEKRVKDETEFKKLKILSFNNLSCIFKKKKKFGIALRNINYAVKLEEELLKADINQ